MASSVRAATTPSPSGLTSNLIRRVIHLRELLPQWVDFQKWIGNLMQSLRQKDPASLEGVEKLITAAELAARLKDDRYSNYARFHQLLQRDLDETLRKSGDGILIWGDAAQDLFPSLDELIRLMTIAGLPVDLIDYLLVWMCPFGLPLAPRQARLGAFLASIPRSPFSTDSTTRRWKTFLDGAEGLAPEALKCLSALGKNTPVAS